ncbi:MAG: methyltransferase domain-containing protein [Anaerolineae bacterium]|nr:methyltransferase domain-containing protein [Anaerolineae bacterium]
MKEKITDPNLAGVQQPGRAKREIAHGEFLAAEGAEYLWGWGTPAGMVRYRRRAQLIADAAGLNHTGRVLEIGCGTGLFTDIFAKYAMKVTAVDISPDLIEMAANRALPAEKVEFICAGFEQIPGKDAFDAVVGSSVLHHLEVAESLERINRLLKPGGRLVFAEPNMLNPQIFAERKLLRSRLKQVSPDETAFVRWDLAKLLAKKGFVNIHIHPFDWLHPAVPGELIAPVSALGRIFEKVPLLKEFSGSLLIRAHKPL